MVSRKAGSGCGIHPSPSYTLEPSLFRGMYVPGTFFMECHPKLTQSPRKGVKEKILENLPCSLHSRITNSCSKGVSGVERSSSNVMNLLKEPCGLCPVPDRAGGQEPSLSCSNVVCVCSYICGSHSSTHVLFAR